MRLFIGCGSEKVDEKYLENSKKLVEKLASIKDVNLSFGAYDHGMMGFVYHTFLDNHKNIMGVTIDLYKDQFEELECDEEIVVDTTMDRAKTLYQKSDVILLLPGGLGTYTELFCMLEEHRTIMDNKKIILYNDNFFYTPLLEELYHLYENHFSSKNVGELISIESDPEEIIKMIKESREK